MSKLLFVVSVYSLPLSRKNAYPKLWSISIVAINLLVHHNNQWPKGFQFLVLFYFNLHLWVTVWTQILKLLCSLITWDYCNHYFDVVENFEMLLKSIAFCFLPQLFSPSIHGYLLSHAPCYYAWVERSKSWVISIFRWSYIYQMKKEIQVLHLNFSK